jgi:hypothetical protein
MAVGDALTGKGPERTEAAIRGPTWECGRRHALQGDFHFEAPARAAGCVPIAVPLHSSL